MLVRVLLQFALSTIRPTEPTDETKRTPVCQTRNIRYDSRAAGPSANKAGEERAREEKRREGTDGETNV